MLNRYKLAPLIDRRDLDDECIRLLNEEWPRSEGARRHSQEKSCRREPPLSLLLIDTQDDTLVGHSRVCRLPARATHCWIESVIVAQRLRGQGVGKVLMTLTETAARGFGFDQAYLCTDDKAAFYERCGYAVCDAIVHSSATTSVFPIDVDLTPLPTRTPATAAAVVAPPTGAPPPPPPPPMVAPLNNNKVKKITTIDNTYMCKSL